MKAALSTPSQNVCMRTITSQLSLAHFQTVERARAQESESDTVRLQSRVRTHLRSSSVRRSSGRHPQHHSSSKTTMDLPHTLMIKNDNRESGFRLVLGQLVRIVTQKSFVQIWQYQCQKYNQPESFLASLGVGHWPCFQVVLCSNPDASLRYAYFMAVQWFIIQLPTGLANIK